MEDAYRSFLRSSDLATWQSCLQHYRDLANGGAAALPRLAEALCIAQYTLWLGWLCGEDKIEEAAQQAFDAFAARAAREDLMATPDGVLVLGLIAGARGYGATAMEIFRRAELEIPLQIAIFLMPEPPARRAQLLRDLIDPDPGTTHFLPAVYFYAHALLDLGYFDQVRSILARIKRADEVPLLIDLSGKLAELSGHWAEARRLYQASNWTTHLYRASICSVILDPSARQTGVEDLRAEEKLLRGMQLGDGEIQQTEVLRTAALVNACRWYHFDNWMVQYELGFLNFRRRRHAEAEEHFKASANGAPAAARFAIDSLRFVNLTWYSDPGVDTRPETLECAHATLDAPAPEREKAHIRTYVARETRDLSVLEPIDRSCSAFDRGDAYEIRGQIPEALHSWTEAIAKAHVPRALQRLIGTFADCGFRETTDYLIGIAINEAEDDFFDLWELGDTLRSVSEVSDAGFAPGINVERPLERVVSRLEQLAEFEFQHLIRAHGFFIRLKRGDLADRVLKRADRFAESAEEHLVLARASSEELGRRHLLRAEREASHRGMRIDIARRNAELGQIARARRILNAAGVFDPGTRLEPLEYASVLKCPSPCLTDDERTKICMRAARHLDEDIKAGLHPRYGGLFIERLKELGAELSQDLHSRFARADDGEIGAEKLWNTWASTLERLDEPTQLDEERRIMQARAAGYGDDEMALFHHLSVWRNLRKQIDAIQHAIKSTRPEREPAETPIRRAAFEHARADEIARLWRAQLSAKDPNDAEALLEPVRKFYREEAELERAWEAQRHSDMQRDLQKAQTYVDWATDVLDQIEEAVRRQQFWPVFMDVERQILEDIAELRADLTREFSIEKLGNEQTA